MFNIDIIAGGKLKASPLLSLWDEYYKRTRWSITLHEIDETDAAAYSAKVLDKLDPRAFIFMLDEHGKDMGSKAFADKLDDLSAEGVKNIQFVIGNADGIPKALRQKANYLLSFGSQTWPHMLVRVMLSEQIYRAQQIMAGHPYHRE